MKKELQIMEGVFNSGEIILENGYKNVMLCNEIDIPEYGQVNVRILITQDFDEVESMELLNLYAENVEENSFLAWFPINSSLSCRAMNNFIGNEKESERICVNLISLFGLRKLSSFSSKDEEKEAA